MALKIRAAADKHDATNPEPPMTIKRHEPTKIYNAVVEANGFVFLAGITPKTLTKDIKGQTQEVVDEIDRLLKVGGTDKSKIVSATLWLNDIRHRDLMNEIWIAWTGGQNLPVRACVEAKLADQRMLVEIQVTAVK
jgi:enamine deaminase RidA (YjgF/YER057c/UK114 family)